MLVAVHRAGAHSDGMNPGLRAELLLRTERGQAAQRIDDPEAFGQVDAENLCHDHIHRTEMGPAIINMSQWPATATKGTRLSNLGYA